MRGKTVVRVTHHPETLDCSYAIYRLEGGKLKYYNTRWHSMIP